MLDPTWIVTAVGSLLRKWVADTRHREILDAIKERPVRQPDPPPAPSAPPSPLQDYTADAFPEIGGMRLSWAWKNGAPPISPSIDYTREIRELTVRCPACGANIGERPSFLGRGQQSWTEFRCLSPRCDFLVEIPGNGTEIRLKAVTLIDQKIHAGTWREVG